MKYSPATYAKAFCASLSTPLSPTAEAARVKNLVALLKRNGDAGGRNKIFALIEKMLRAQAGRRKVVVEFAREQKKTARTLLKEFLKPSDIVEEHISPDIVGGVRITVDDEKRLDNSMRRKLEKLFS